ncbi:MAG TPA: ATP-binding cassette domain-containing protein [Acidobacteriota bacterium]|nr:ATP-binding cassette domain-containing protein [Acidobacteriota bacterium]
MSIVLNQISKLYRSQVVVDRVSLEIEDGELFVLLGASGSGKSTILRMIAGLTPPTAGTIHLHGRDVTYLPAQQRDIGLVFQNYSIFRHLNVAENIEFGLSVRKIPANERARRRDELLDLVGLAGLGNRYAHQLSGGQQQRVALARALAHKPKVLLLDEPFGALDVKIRAQLRRSLKEIQRKLKVTTVLVTHEQEEAFELADRIGVIERGRLVEVGESQTLYNKPQTSFVATFLGAGTVLTGRVREGCARFGPVDLPIPDKTGVHEGGRIQVLIRPEHVVLSDESDSGGYVSMGRGRIIEERFTGPERRLRLLLPPLANTRQVAPAVPFGEEGVVIEAAIPAEGSLQNPEPYVRLKGWHLMKPPTPHLLAVAMDSEVDALRHSARWLVEKLDGCATFLTVIPSKGSRRIAEMEKGRGQAAFSRIESCLREGDFVTEVLAELREKSYEMLLLASALKRPSGPAGRFHSSSLSLERLLQQTTIPILLVQGGVEKISRILICTAAGEPGKVDVREGGRLARRLGAHVTLLHVRAKGNARVAAHLEQAAATLRTLEVEVDVRIRLAPDPAAGILAEIREGNHDLIVVGRPDPGSQKFLGDDDVTRQILSGTDRPVLIISSEIEADLWGAATFTSTVVQSQNRRGSV